MRKWLREKASYLRAVRAVFDFDDLEGEVQRLRHFLEQVDAESVVAQWVVLEPHYEGFFLRLILESHAAKRGHTK